MRSVPHDDVMAEVFSKDPAYALALLNDILGDPEAMPAELLIVLRQVAKANGGLTAVAKKASLNPTQLYRTLSPDGNPSLTTLTAILRAVDLQLIVKRVKPAAAVGTQTQPVRTRKKPARVTTASVTEVQATR